jgi:hypothetical protein
MDDRTNLVLAAHVYPRRTLFYVMAKPQFLQRRVIARGEYPYRLDEGFTDEYEALLCCALEAWRVHGR